MSSNFTESVVEESVLAWLDNLGRRVRHALDIAPGGAGAERTGDGFFAPVPMKRSPERFRAASRRKIENWGY